MNSDKRDPIIEQNEFAFIEKAHALSVSGDPVEQAAARAYKELLPAFVTWLNNERARGTPDDIVISILPTFVASQIATAILNKVPHAKLAARLMDKLKPEFDKEWQRVRAQVRAQTKV